MSTIGETSQSKVTSRGDFISGTRGAHTPIINVTVDSTDLRPLGHIKLIKRLMVEETVNKMNYAEIVFENNDMNMTDDDILVSGGEMEIATGYSDTLFVTRDTFEMGNPLFRAAKSGVVVVRGYGRAILMSRDEKRRMFVNKTHSGIAKQIATEYGFDVDVDDTTLSYPKIMQAGRTDYQFLFQLAQLNGFEFFVEQDVLHFHSIRERKNNETGKVEPVSDCFYGRKRGTVIQQASFTIESEGHAVSVEMTDFDPLQGTSFNVTGVDSGKSVLNETDNVSTWQDLSAIRKIFLADTGQFLSQAEAQNIVNGAVNANKYVVKAVMRCVGDPQIHARSIIGVNGVGRFTGVYYVTRVTHTIQGQFYTCDIECTKTFLRKVDPKGGLVVATDEVQMPTAGDRDDITAQSQSSGNVSS